MQKIKLSDKALLEAIRHIAKEVKSLQPDAVVAIERGGIPLGVYLSAYLNVPLEKIQISFYKDTVKQKTPIVDFKKFDITDYKAPLFVDDLVDTGDTFRFVKETFGNVPYVTLYSSETITPDIYYFTKDKDQWITFPWDKENDEFDYKFSEEGWWKQLTA